MTLTLVLNTNCSLFSILWDEIIFPICTSWGKQKIIGQLTPHLHIYKPGIFKRLALWTTYPITTLLKTIAFKLESQQAAQSPDYFYLLETAASLERTLAFAHTGSARVLLRELMQPLWITRGLRKHRYPALNPKIISLHVAEGEPPQLQVSIRGSQWPLGKDNLVMRASARTAELTYNPSFSQVRMHLSYIVAST